VDIAAFNPGREVLCLRAAAQAIKHKEPGKDCDANENDPFPIQIHVLS
jgi:hypothetical protein